MDSISVPIESLVKHMKETFESGDEVLVQSTRKRKHITRGTFVRFGIDQESSGDFNWVVVKNHNGKLIAFDEIEIMYIENKTKGILYDNIQTAKITIRALNTLHAIAGFGLALGSLLILKLAINYFL